MQELALDDLSAREVEAIDARVQAAAVALKLDRLAAEVGARAEHVDRERVPIGAREEIDAVGERIAELQVNLPVGDGGVEPGRAVGGG